MSAPLDTPRDSTILDDDLILFYYGELRQPEKIRRRLESDPELQSRYDELCRALDAVDTLPVPEPELHYGQRVWNRLQDDLEADRQQVWWKRWGQGLGPPRLRAMATLTALLAVAFFTGRYWHLMQTPTQNIAAPGVFDAEAEAAASRQRIVTNVVAEHLERSERLLIEIANASGETVDVGLERQSAENLLPANRLYRQSTRQTGQADLTAVLDELERLLLDLAHGPEEIAAVDLEDFRSRIDDVLFKVQVLGWSLRQQQQTPPQSHQPKASHQPNDNSV